MRNLLVVFVVLFAIMVPALAHGSALTDSIAVKLESFDVLMDYNRSMYAPQGTLESCAWMLERAIDTTGRLQTSNIDTVLVGKIQHRLDRLERTNCVDPYPASQPAMGRIYARLLPLICR